MVSMLVANVQHVELTIAAYSSPAVISEAKSALQKEMESIYWVMCPATSASPRYSVGARMNVTFFSKYQDCHYSYVNFQFLAE